MDFLEFDTRIAAYAVIVDNADRMLLTWYNGSDNVNPPGWSLPGGGIDFAETVQEGLAREVHEEAGYEVEVGAPLLVDSFTRSRSVQRPRPFKAVRLLFDARIVGGELGTTEQEGTTDFAEWVETSRIPDLASRAEVLDLALRTRGR